MNLSTPYHAMSSVQVPRTATTVPVATRTIRRPCVKRHEQPRQQQQSQHFQQQPLWREVACMAAQSEQVSYEWSWRQGRSKLLESCSAFDADHPIPADINIQETVALLSKAAAAMDSEQPDMQPSQAWMQQLEQQSIPLLQQLQADITCQVLQHYSELDHTPSEPWMVAFMQQLCSQLQQLSTQQLSLVVWSLSNLRYTPDLQQWTALLQAAGTRLQDFYGPDLAQFVCAAGSIYANSNSSFDLDTGVRQQPLGSDTAAESALPPAAAAAQPALKLPDGWQEAVVAEAEYQVKEFVGDLGAFDLARLASGLADLGISPSSKLQDALLKAVYMRTRTIEEKGAVDFALAKLDAKGKKSMHYDPRWTHEELKWLPRRERDKRRILKEGWYRTQWTGYRPGQ